MFSRRGHGWQNLLFNEMRLAKKPGIEGAAPLHGPLEHMLGHAVIALCSLKLDHCGGEQRKMSLVRSRSEEGAKAMGVQGYSVERGNM